MTKIRDFEKPNMGGGFICPICGTSEEKRVRLIPIKGTEEGNICGAKQIHTDCLPPVEGLVYINGLGVLIQEKEQNG